MTDPYILQAREMMAVEIEKRNCPDSASNYRKGYYDNNFFMAVLARVLREHDESQPTFEQRVQAMEGALRDIPPSVRKGFNMTEAYDRHLAEIMAPPVDPLVKAMDELGWCNTDALASDLRKALAARNHEIREITK